MRSLRLLALVVMIIVAGRAADDGGTKPDPGGFASVASGKDGGDAKEAKDAKAKPKAAAAGKKPAKPDPWEGAESPIPPVGGNEAADREVALRGTALASVTAFATSRNLALEPHQGRAVTLLLIGGVVGAKIDELVQAADLGLIGLETWTGLPKVFAPKPMPDDERYVLVVFAKQADRDAYLDTLHGKDMALIKAVASVDMARLVVTDARMLQFGKWWAVYSSSQLAINAFFLERGHQAPAWIHEGLGAELQRLVCAKQVKCYTISYENGALPKLDGDWAPEVAKLIAGGGQLVLSANTVFPSETVKIPGETYKQMWSLCTFLRAQAHNEIGPGNKFLRTLCDIAKGTPSSDAVKLEYGQEDPALTKAWHAWAAAQR